MRWSTKKFAMDILWACGEMGVSLPDALKMLPEPSHPTRCPLLTIGDDRWDGIEYNLFGGPYCNKMARMWDDYNKSPKNIRLCRSRIKAVKQWFKDNGYLKGEDNEK